MAIYDAGEATDNVVVETRYPDWGNLHGRKAPWNSAWKIPQDSDAMVAVVDFDTGHSWEFWGDTRLSNGRLLAGSGNLIQENIDATWNEPANVFTKENGYRVVRESGFPSAYLVATREEIEAGTHSPCPNLVVVQSGQGVSMWDQRSREGAQSADRVIACPWGQGSFGISPMRISMPWTKTLDPDVKKGMRAIAVALRDYGGIGSDHAGQASDRLAERSGSSTTTAHVGMKSVFRAKPPFVALHPLLSKNKHRVRAVAPCTWPDGDENKVCCYPDDIVNYPSGHDCHS